MQAFSFSTEVHPGLLYVYVINEQFSSAIFNSSFGPCTQNNLVTFCPSRSFLLFEATLQPFTILHFAITSLLFFITRQHDARY